MSVDCSVETIWHCPNVSNPHIKPCLNHWYDAETEETVLECATVKGTQCHILHCRTSNTSSSIFSNDKLKRKRKFKRYSITVTDSIEVIAWSHSGEGSRLLLVTRRGVLCIVRYTGTSVGSLDQTDSESYSKEGYSWALHKCTLGNRQRSRCLLGTKIMSVMKSDEMNKSFRSVVAFAGTLTNPSIMIIDMKSSDVLCKQSITEFSDNQTNIKVSSLRLEMKESLPQSICSYLESFLSSSNFLVSTFDRYNAILFVGTKDGCIYCNFLSIEGKGKQCELSVAIKVATVEDNEEIIDFYRMGEHFITQGIYGNVYDISKLQIHKVSSSSVLVNEFSYQDMTWTSMCEGPRIGSKHISLIATLTDGSSILLNVNTSKPSNITQSFSEAIQLPIRRELSMVISHQFNDSTYCAFVTFRGALVLCQMNHGSIERGQELLHRKGDDVSSFKVRRLLKRLKVLTDSRKGVFDEAHLLRLRDAFRIAGVLLSSQSPNNFPTKTLQCSYALSSTTLNVSIPSSSYLELSQLVGQRSDEWIYSVHLMQSLPKLEYLSEYLNESFKRDPTISQKRRHVSGKDSLPKPLVQYGGCVTSKGISCTCLQRESSIRLRCDLWDFNSIAISTSLEMRFHKNSKNTSKSYTHRLNKRCRYKDDNSMLSMKVSSPHLFELSESKLGIIIPIRGVFGHWNISYALEKVNDMSVSHGMCNLAESIATKILENEEPLGYETHPIQTELNHLSRYNKHSNNKNVGYIASRVVYPSFLSLSSDKISGLVFGHLIVAANAPNNTKVEQEQDVFEEMNTMSIAVTGFNRHHKQVAKVLPMLRASLIRYILLKELQDEEKSTMALAKYYGALSSRSIRVEIRRLEFVVEKLKTSDLNDDIIFQLYEKLRQIKLR